MKNTLVEEPRPSTSNPQPNERPWQFSPLHLFGLTTVVAVCAAAFSWGTWIGILTVALVLPLITTLYRTRAVIKTAAPTLRTRSLGTLLAFAIFTSNVTSLAALVAFTVTCSSVGVLAMGQQTPFTSVPILAVAFLLGGVAAFAVLYRSWPSQPPPK